MNSALQPMSFKPSESLSERIAQHLADQIICGNMAPRERVQELRIAGELGVSRGSVREALLILERRHLVEIIARRGAVVTELSSHYVDSLYEMVESMYSLLAIKVAAVWDEDDLEPFLDLFTTMREFVLLEQTQAYFNASTEFPRLGYSLVQNIFMQETLEDLAPAISRVHYQALHARPGDLSRSLGFFGGILDGMLHRDANQIESTVHDFCVYHRDLALEALGD